MTTTTVSPAGTRHVIGSLASLLESYQAGLPALSDAELTHRAAVVAALPGRLGDELRRLVDVEREHRQAPQRATTPARRPSRTRLVIGLPLLFGAPAYTSYLTGRNMAGQVDVPEQVVWAPVVVAAAAGVAAVAAGVARWAEHRRYASNELVDEPDLDTDALALLNRVRVQRREREELA